MALSTHDIVSTVDFNTLVSSINTELARRKYTNKVDSYATVQTVSENGSVLATQGASVIEAVGRISDDELPATPVIGALLNPLEDLTTKIADYISRPLVGSNSGCSGGCNGLCQGCNNTCTGGCSGSCKGGCSGGCGSCGSGCESGCWGCSGQCSGSSCGWKGL